MNKIKKIVTTAVIAVLLVMSGSVAAIPYTSWATYDSSTETVRLPCMKQVDYLSGTAYTVEMVRVPGPGPLRFKITDMLVDEPECDGIQLAPIDQSLYGMHLGVPYINIPRITTTYGDQWTANLEIVDGSAEYTVVFLKKL